MKLFRHEARQHSAESRRVYALYEIARTAVDFLAAICFVVGSIFFFYDSLMTAGTWLFLIGSFFFAAKPTLKLSREIHLYRMGKDDALATRLEG